MKSPTVIRHLADSYRVVVVIDVGGEHYFQSYNYRGTDGALTLETSVRGSAEWCIETFDIAQGAEDEEIQK